MAILTRRDGVRLLRCDAFGCKREIRFASICDNDEIEYRSRMEFAVHKKENFCRDCLAKVMSGQPSRLHPEQEATT